MRKLRLQKIKTLPQGLQWAGNKPEINTLSDSEVNKPKFNTMLDSKSHAFNTWISSHLIIKHGKCPDGQHSFGIFCQNISIFSFNRKSYYYFYRCSNPSYVTVKSWHEMKIPRELFKFGKHAWYLQWGTIYTTALKYIFLPKYILQVFDYYEHLHFFIYFLAISLLYTVIKVCFLFLFSERTLNFNPHFILNFSFQK